MSQRDEQDLSKDRGLKIILLGTSITLATIIGVAMLWLSLQWAFAHRTFNYVVGRFVDVTGFSPYLVKGIVVLLIFPFLLAVREVVRFRLRKSAALMPKSVAYGVIVMYISGFFLSMYFASRETYFGHKSGEVQKYYAITPEGIRFYDTPGYDPKYGIELKPASPEIIENLERADRGLIPERIVTESIEELDFFERLTGQAKVWYYKDKEGQIEIYSSSGYHPAYGEELKPITRDIIGALKAQRNAEAERQRLEQERARREREAREQTARQAEAERKRKAYLDRYLNRRRTTARHPAILVINSGRDINRRVTEQLAAATSGSGSILSEAFVSDGLFRNAFAGDPSQLRGLGIDNLAPTVILGVVEAVGEAADWVHEGLRRTEISLSVRVYDTADYESRTVTTTAVGAGFSETQAMTKAEKLAVEKLIPLLHTD